MQHRRNRSFVGNDEINEIYLYDNRNFYSDEKTFAERGGKKKLEKEKKATTTTQINEPVHATSPLLLLYCSYCIVVVVLVVTGIRYRTYPFGMDNVI